MRHQTALTHFMGKNGDLSHSSEKNEGSGTWAPESILVNLERKSDTIYWCGRRSLVYVQLLTHNCKNCVWNGGKKGSPSGCFLSCGTVNCPKPSLIIIIQSPNYCW